MKPATLLGLRTAIYQVTDMAEATRWYRSVLQIDPYFDQPYYVGFNVGGFELGLHPVSDAHPPGMGGVVVYWGVEKMSAAWERLISLGAVSHEGPTDVGEGIVVATAKDPFGNLFGLIENPHFPNTA